MAGEGHRIAISDFHNMKIPGHIDQQKKVYGSYVHSDHHSLCTRPCTCSHMNLVCWYSWRWHDTGWIYIHRYLQT